jgi:hypothetical protein
MDQMSPKKYLVPKTNFGSFLLYDPFLGEFTRLYGHSLEGVRLPLVWGIYQKVMERRVEKM